MYTTSDHRKWTAESFNTEEGRGRIKEVLQKGEANVTFIKKDGTVREMTCTLFPQSLPFVESTSTPRKQSEEALRVFDLGKNEWRSFRFDSITKFKY